MVKLLTLSCALSTNSSEAGKFVCGGISSTFRRLAAVRGWNEAKLIMANHQGLKPSRRLQLAIYDDGMGLKNVIQQSLHVLQPAKVNLPPCNICPPCTHHHLQHQNQCKLTLNICLNLNVNDASLFVLWS